MPGPLEHVAHCATSPSSSLSLSLQILLISIGLSIYFCTSHFDFDIRFYSHKTKYRKYETNYWDFFSFFQSSSIILKVVVGKKKKG